MLPSNTLLRIAAIASLAVLPAACANQPASQPRTSGVQGTQSEGMQGMDMQTMMNQCAAMRRQMAQGIHPNTPGMTPMMAHCDEMDRSMGTGGTASAPAPAATRSR